MFLLYSLLTIFYSLSNGTSATKHHRLRKVFAAGIALFGLGLCVIDFGQQGLSVPLTPYRLDLALTRTAGLLTLAGSAILWWRGSAQAAFAVLASCLGVGLVFTLGYRAPVRGDQTLSWNHLLPRPGSSSNSGGRPLERVWSSPADWTERHTEYHPKYATMGVPNIVARQHHRDFDVVYTMNAEGFRVMPEPTGPPPHPSIVFLGCSITFGVGVGDTESYPAILAREAWQHFRVHNDSISGWGTVNALARLEEVLKEQTPACVFYAYFDGHLVRNRRRHSWFANSNGNPIEVRDDGSTGAVLPTSAATEPDDPEQDEREMQTTLLVLARMQRICAQKKVPLIVLVVDKTDNRSMLRLASVPGLRMIDLRPLARDRYAHDYHPTPRAHRFLAAAIASDRRIAEWTGIAELWQPTAVQTDMEGAYFLDMAPNHDAKLEVDRWRPRWARVDHIVGKPDGSSVTQWVAWLPPVRKGEWYHLETRLRSNTSRTVQISLVAKFWTQFLSPDNVTSTWQTFPGEFQAPADEQHPFLYINLGNSNAPLEIDDFSFRPSPLTRELAGFHARHVGDGKYFCSLAPLKSSGVRIERIHCPDLKPWQLHVVRTAPALQKGKRYAVHAKLRADRPRKVDLSVQQTTTPWHDFGLYETLAITVDWKEFQFGFVATATSHETEIAVRIGASDVPVEIEYLRLETMFEVDQRQRAGTNHR